MLMFFFSRTRIWLINRPNRLLPFHRYVLTMAERFYSVRTFELIYSIPAKMLQSTSRIYVVLQPLAAHFQQIPNPKEKNDCTFAHLLDEMRIDRFVMR